MHSTCLTPWDLTRVGIWGKEWIVSVGAGAELRGVGTLASPWQEGAGARGTRATQASPPHIIPTPAPTGTKALPKRHDKIPTRERLSPEIRLIYTKYIKRRISCAVVRL